jgi:hypothetical protein
MTYEGCIDETFGIKTAQVTIEESIIDSEIKGPSQTTLKLTNEDIVFEETRDLNFGVLRDVFPKKLQLIQRIIDEGEQHRSLKDLEIYMEKLKDLKLPQQKKSITHRKRKF